MSKYFVGVDIASSAFMVSVGTQPWKLLLKPQEFENTEDGYQALLDYLSNHQMSASQTVVCMEATGVYSEGLAYFLFAKGYQVAVQPPLEVKRAFKPNTPKTDALDSIQIAEYACRFADRLTLWKPRAEILEQVKVLLATREQFVAQNTAHKNALQAIQRKAIKTPFAEQAHEQIIEQFKKQIHAIDQEIRRLIESDPSFKQTLLLLLSILGVGLTLAAHMLLFTSVSIHHKQLASFLGIAPQEYSSGSSVFKMPSSRHFGPPAARKLLYLAACSLRTHQQQFKAYFLRKTAQGKSPRLVLNNIANKLIKIICAVLRSQKPFVSDYCSVNPAILKMPLTSS
jgi:transposase